MIQTLRVKWCDGLDAPQRFRVLGTVVRGLLDVAAMPYAEPLKVEIPYSVNAVVDAWEAGRRALQARSIEEGSGPVSVARVTTLGYLAARSLEIGTRAQRTLERRRREESKS